MSKYGDKTRIIKCPNCGNAELQLHRGVHYTKGKGEEYGFCDKCHNIVISDYFIKNGLTYIGTQDYMLITMLLREKGIIK